MNTFLANDQKKINDVLFLKVALQPITLDKCLEFVRKQVNWYTGNGGIVAHIWDQLELMVSNSQSG